MELIIKVPDEVLESKQYCQYFGVCSDKLIETIEGGTPYIEIKKGDSVSRSVLKKAVEPYRGKAISTSIVLDIIDNAQAIPLPSNQIAWEQGYEAGLAQGKQERKGEWIYHEKLNNYFCKDCGLIEPFTKEEIEEGIKLPNFCQQCGADMRGDNNE